MAGRGQDEALALLKTQKSMFVRGSDILREKMRNKILLSSVHSAFYADDFKEFGSYQMIRKALEQLVELGFLVKVKAYPVFYERAIK